MAGGAGLGGSMTVVGVLFGPELPLSDSGSAALDHEDLLASRPNFFSAALLGWVLGSKGCLVGRLLMWAMYPGWFVVNRFSRG